MATKRKFRKQSDVVEPVRIDFEGDPGKTKQAHADECDIDRLVNHYQRTGQMKVSREQGYYGEYTGMQFHEAMNLVVEAQSKFLELPHQLRNRFRNDPGEFLDFVNNPENLEEARELGIVEKEQEPVSPMKVEVVNSPETPSDPA